MIETELLDAVAASPPEQLATMRRAIARALGILRVPRPLRLSEWAERHFYLSAESSYVEGRWQAWPFQRGMLDVMGHDEIPQVTIRKSARVGYTKCLLAWIGYAVEHKRRNGVVYQPTDDDRDEFVSAELDPMLRDVRALRRVMPRVLSRSKDNTLRLKKFAGALVHLRGGKAAKNFRRLTVDWVVYDELSGFDRDIEREGSPTKLGDKRVEGATWPKSIAGSTPKLRHNDNTEDREAEASVHLRWHVPCPHCGELHALRWGTRGEAHGMRWIDNDTSTIAHACPHCGGLMRQAEYLEVWHAGLWLCERTGVWLDQAGRWRSAATAPDWRVCETDPNPATITEPPRHVAMHVWTACAPQATWQQIADEFIAASRLAERGDVSLLKTWINTTLGETWVERGEAADEHALQSRAEDYPLCIVPVGGLVLTAGVDLQGNRCEIGVWAWGRGMESWDVDHQVIELNPVVDSEWLAVEEYLMRRYPQAWGHGGTLGIDAVSIDSNFHTQAVFAFVRRMQHRIRCHAVRGEGAEGLPIKGPGRPQDINWKGQRWQAGIRQWSVGTDAAKDLLHGQLQLATPGPGYLHLNRARPREWFEQLTAEQRVQVRRQGGQSEAWIKRRPRNEVLDCRVYATHAAWMIGLDKWTDARWTELEQRVQPPRDLFSAPLPAEPARPILAALPIGTAEPGAALPAAAPAAPRPAPPPVPASVPAGLISLVGARRFGGAAAPPERARP